MALRGRRDPAPLAGVLVELEKGRIRVDEHRRTPAIGRSHGIHAEPVTFGMVLAGHLAEWLPGRLVKVKAASTTRGAKRVATRITKEIEEIRAELNARLKAKGSW